MTAFILNQWVPSDGCTCAGGNANAPVNTSLPVISGNPVVGQILTCSAGVWDGIPTTFLYQWQRDDTSISGAIHSTYTLVLADGLHAIRCVVSAINSFGATSTPSTAVSVPYPAPLNTSPPTVSGTGKVGATLTCWEGAWDNSPTSFTFQWQRNGTVSVGSGSTYVPIDADVGQSIRCIVTAFNSGGIVPATSNSVAVTSNVPVNTATPVVTGLPYAGATFSCTQGTWTNVPTGFAYQWLRDGANIVGATLSTYLGVTADQGHSVSCAVIASNAGGASIAANSNAIAIAVPFVFPGAPAALYSLRNVGPGYAGKAVNVRRANDSATQDIGFDLGNNFDVAAALSFGAGTVLYVTKWYDQSGHTLDAVQTNVGLQPQLVIIGGKPWVAFGIGFLSSSQLLGVVSGTVTPSGAMTVGYTVTDAADLACIPVNDVGSGWFTQLNNSGSGTTLTLGNHPGSANFWATGFTTDTSNLYLKNPNRVAFTLGSGTGQAYVNGVATSSASGMSTTPVANGFQIGGYGANFPFAGMISEVYVYGSVLSGANLSSIDASEASYWPDLGFQTPYRSGQHSVQFGVGESITCGNVLNFERNQAWSFTGDFQIYTVGATGNSAACVFFTNVPASGTAEPGYEVWVDNIGFLRVRIISDIGANNYLGVVGTTNVCDAAKHRVWVTYDGSSTAAGVKVYIDGNAETTAVEHDALTSNIGGVAGQSLVVGGQQGINYFNPKGTMGLFQIDTVARSGAYVSANGLVGTLPPVDANTGLSYQFTDASGATVTDASGNGHNGTLTHATMRIS